MMIHSCSRMATRDTEDGELGLHQPEQDMEFGEIEFIGASRGTTKSKFVKISQKLRDRIKSMDAEGANSTKKVLDKISNQWDIGPAEGNKRPNLLISVLGGAWDFPMDKHVQDVFRKGIVEAADCTNALIITGGTNVGVMKYVGTALGDYEVGRGRNEIEQRFVSVGIITWGTLRKDHQLEMKRALADPNDKLAKLNTKKANETGVFLDPNHSYFILVDGHKFGDELTVREKLEDEIVKEWNIQSLKEHQVFPRLPVVNVVINGGMITMEYAYRALKRHIPVLVVDKSGRAADVFADKKVKYDDSVKTPEEKCNNAESADTSEEKDSEIAKLRVRLDKLESRSDEKKQGSGKKHDPESVEKESAFDIFQYVSVYQHRDDDQQNTRKTKKRIDQAILSAAAKGVASGVNGGEAELQLVQIWGRSDIIDYGEMVTTITTNPNWDEATSGNSQHETHKDIVEKAVINNHLEILQLFVDNNIVKLDTYMNKTKLAQLYKDLHVLPSSPLYQLRGLRRKDHRPSRVWMKSETSLKNDGKGADDEKAHKVLSKVERILKQLTISSFELLNDDHKTGYDWYRTVPNTSEYEFVLPPIPEGTKTIIFRVKAERDVNIALSSDNKVNDESFEIHLGMKCFSLSRGAYQLSKIVHGKREWSCGQISRERTNISQKIHEKEILSKEEFREFYITFGIDLCVGRVGEPPFLSTDSKHESRYKYKDCGDHIQDLSCIKALRRSEIDEGKSQSLCCIKALRRSELDEYKILQDVKGIKHVGFSTGVGVTGGWEFSSFGYEEYKLSKLAEQDGKNSANKGDSMPSGAPYVLPKIPGDRKIITFRLNSNSSTNVRITLRSSSTFGKEECDEYKIVLEDKWYISRNDEDTEAEQELTDRIDHKQQSPFSQEHFRHFYICLDKGIQFGEVGEEFHYLQYDDEEKTGLNIDHIEFSTGNNNEEHGIQFSSYEFLDGEVLPDPIRQLFLFALLNKYYDMAHYFWEEGEEHIAAALTACMIYDSIAETQNSEVQEILYQHKKKFEDLAYDILTECEGESEGEDTHQLLLHKSPRWGYANHLQLAQLADSLKFLSHPAVHRLLDKIWEDGLPEEDQGDKKGYAVVKFLDEAEHDDEYDQHLEKGYFIDVVSTTWLTDDCKACWWPPFTNPDAAAKAVEKHLPHDRKTWSTYNVKVVRRDDNLVAARDAVNKLTSGEADQTDDGIEPSKGIVYQCKKVMSRSPTYYIPKDMLLLTPRAKFRSYVATYIAFLIYFSYVMVTDKLSDTSYDVVLMLWVATYIFDEMRQVINPNSTANSAFAEVAREDSWKTQISLYFLSPWNWMDVLMLLLFVTGEITRWAPGSGSTGRIILAFSLFVFYLRFLQHLTIVSSNIGTKVLMIFKTIEDFLSMVIILVVVLIGYGVVAQAILYPYITDTRSIANGIFFRPVFQIYGELFLDDLTGNTCSKNETEIHLGIHDPCPENAEWGIVFLVIYMLLSNILLLNIFIAMFSTACEVIKNKEDLYWSLQYYNMTEHFFNSPRLPPPFIIISHLLLVIQALYRCWSGEKIGGRSGEKEKFLQSMKMEERCAYNYVLRKRNEKTDSSNTRILAQLKELEKEIKEDEKIDKDDMIFKG